MTYHPASEGGREGWGSMTYPQIRRWGRRLGQYDVSPNQEVGEKEWPGVTDLLMGLYYDLLVEAV